MSAATFTGHVVIDRDGVTVGTVTDVFYADSADQPEWLIIDPGVFRKERLIPVAGAYSTADGKVTVPFDKELIKGAPVVGSNHYPAPATRQQAAQHFGISN